LNGQDLKTLWEWEVRKGNIGRILSKREKSEFGIKPEKRSPNRREEEKIVASNTFQEKDRGIKGGKCSSLQAGIGREW